MRKLFFVLTIVVLLCSCGGRRMAGTTGEGDTLYFKYAQLLTVEQYDGYRLVTIKNPWKKGAVLHRYQLIDNRSNPSNQNSQTPILDDATVVRVPLERSVVFTSLHASLIDVMGAEQQVAGVADSKYMKVGYVMEGIRDGRILDCGDGMSPVIEKIIDAEADAILLSPFENSGGYGRLEEIDIPLIECAEYMERSPLARAEWVRFYGMLYGKEKEADSLFSLVDSNYGLLKKLATTSRLRPSVLMDKQTGPVWYVPGGQSTIGRMLQDAQCHYPFADDDHSGSLALTFETILEKNGDADVWLLRYDSERPLQLRELLTEQPGYPQLRPVKTGNVFGCNVSTSMFYEESPFRPDLLLQDFIQILHPDIPNMPPLRYYQKVK